MIIDYLATKSFMQSIDIVDAGNTCLECKSNSGLFYYYITKSVAGFTHVLTLGPILLDYKILTPDLEISYKKMKYNPGKLEKEITKFVNNPFNQIEDVKEILIEELPDEAKLDYIELFTQID